MQYIEYNDFKKNIEDMFDFLNNKSLFIKKGEKVFSLIEVNEKDIKEETFNKETIKSIKETNENLNKFQIFEDTKEAFEFLDNIK
jgi:hypothetical protein